MGNKDSVIHGITPYEIRICVLMFLLMVPDVFVGLSVLNTQYTPSFHCDFKLKNGSKTISWSSLESEIHSKFANSVTPIHQRSIVEQSENSCEKYNLTLDVESIFNASQAKLSTLRNTTSTIPCENFIFQTGYVTAVTEFELVCNNAWKEAFVTSLFMFGGLIGSVSGGTCSDRLIKVFM
ncbi:solute carrier family 22 member 4-like [Ciona intestinalis]